jgi:hypothetical protein
MITIDDITLPVIASTICKNASTLRMQKLNNSSARSHVAERFSDTLSCRRPGFKISAWRT